jgi:hypothetical protein
MMKPKLLILGLALCLTTVPASAMPDLFGFRFGNIEAVFDGVTSFSTMDWMQTTGDLYRNESPGGTAEFTNGLWGMGSESFLVSMAIDNISAATADGAGSFAIVDIQGDIVGGDIRGSWVRMGDAGVFIGTLTNVTYTSVADDMFDGHSGNASMIFSAPQPWDGTLVELTAGGAWFTLGSSATLHSFDVKGGSAEAMIEGLTPGTTTGIPAPGAFVLGLLGAGILGLGRRRPV